MKGAPGLNPLSMSSGRHPAYHNYSPTYVPNSRGEPDPEIPVTDQLKANLEESAKPSMLTL